MLMKTPGRRKAKDTSGENSAESLRRELATTDQARVDAVRERLDLEERRSDVVAEGDLDAVEQHDRAIEAAKRRIDIAESAHARLTLELREAEDAEEQARRRAIRAEAEGALTEARRLMRTEYVERAKAVAETLRKVAALRTIALKANDSLPIDAEPIDTKVEPSNARHWAIGSSDEVTELRLFHRVTGEPAPPNVVNGPNYEHRLVKIRRPIPLYPEVPHRAVADFVNLPGLDPQEYIYAAAYWGQPRV